jgi:hypothetical protein
MHLRIDEISYITLLILKSFEVNYRPRKTMHIYTRT